MKSVVQNAAVRASAGALVLTLAIFTLASGIVRDAAGQDADPFGAAPAAPAAAKGKGKPAADAREERDPAILSILESNPKTPEQLTRALEMTLDLGRIDVAQKLLGRLLGQSLDDATLAGLQQKFGSDLFFRLSNTPHLAPKGEEFAQKVMAAADKVVRDPTRLSDRVVKLSDPNLDTRLKALDDLRAAGDAAVAPLVRALVDELRTDEHGAVKQALVRLGDVVVEPLIGALESPQDQLRASVFDVLGRLQASRAAPYLLRPAIASDASPVVRDAARRALSQMSQGTPTATNVRIYLSRRVKSLLEGEPAVRIDLEGFGTLWHWDPKLKMVVARNYPSDLASAAEAARVARELRLVAPDDVDSRRLFLTAVLESGKLLGGLDRPLPRGPGSAHAQAAALGVDAIEDLIPYAQRVDRLPALVGALEVIGDLASPEILSAPDGTPRPVARALGHVDRRVRFAAMDAILKIAPKQPFSGASRVTETLGYCAAAGGVRRILVVLPRADEAQTFVGMLAEAGFEADAATSGRAAFTMAARQPDYEFALISDSLDRPATLELLQMLRQETRSASLPVGVLIAPESVERLRGRYEIDAITRAFGRPYDSEGLQYVVAQLQEQTARRMVGRDERVRQAAAALDWMARLSDPEHLFPFYDLRTQETAVETALATPELSARAAKVLGLFGTPRAQQLLLDFASQNARPISERQAALDAFRQAVDRRGMLLLRTAIEQQYRRYNESETLDPPTQQLLGAILDVIEKKGVAPKNQGEPAQAP